MTNHPKIDIRTRVRDAASQIAALGRTPSVRAVRALTGGGSATTIADELKVWRALTAEPGNKTLKSSGSASTWTGDEFPLALKLEAEAFYCRMLALAQERLSDAGNLQVAAMLATSQKSLELSSQLTKTTEWGCGQRQELQEVLAERALLSERLSEKDTQLKTAADQILSLTDRIAVLTAELADTKLASAAKEVQAYSRAEGLSKHLMRMTDDQRSQIAAPLAALKDQVDGLKMREGALVIQMNNLRDENAALRKIK
jgi:hypothetical protein